MRWITIALVSIAGLAEAVTYKTYNAGAIGNAKFTMYRSSSKQSASATCAAFQMSVANLSTAERDIVVQELKSYSWTFALINSYNGSNNGGNCLAVYKKDGSVKSVSTGCTGSYAICEVRTAPAIAIATATATAAASVGGPNYTITDASDIEENPWYDPRGVFSSCPVKNSVVLTFDDGPTEYTATLLATLREKGVKATFCVIGQMIAESGYAESLRQAYLDGHTIINHTWDHVSLATLTASEMLDNINLSADAIYAVIGVRPKYVRPPYGEINELVISTLTNAGYKLILWNLDTNDWQTSETNPEAIYDVYANSFVGVTDQSKKSWVALQHDLYPSTVDFMGSIIDLARSYGYGFYSVNECFNDSFPYLSSDPASTATIAATTTSTSTATATVAADANWTISDSANINENPWYDARGVFSSCPIKNSLVLTFDDGPSGNTSTLLSILRQKGVKATFFVLGSMIVADPSYAAAMKQAYLDGHTIASHTWSHSSLITLSVDQIVQEMTQTADAIYSVIGRRPRYMRPPYGEYNDQVIDTLTQMGYKLMLWNLDTLDWILYNIDPPSIYQSFANAFDSITPAQQLNKSWVTLQHEIHLESVNQVGNVIDLARSKNYQFYTANQCFGDYDPYM